ncbi:hypothetical protein ACGTI2_21185 (plasmid) [Morganella morganii]|uniref:hypothetical protein n=1 Tax=Morganella morganii TaxID=582 RepID=UPI003867BF78
MNLLTYLEKCLIPLFFIITLSGCLGKPSVTLTIPEKETILKIKSDDKLGIVAESQNITYFFTNEKSKDTLKIYGEFLNDFKDDISYIDVSFIQSSVDDSVSAAYVNYIPVKKVEKKEHLLQKYKNRSRFSNGMVEIGFSTRGNFIVQPNTLPEQYRLPTPIEVKVKQGTRKSENDELQRMGAALMIPIFIPFMMIGCMVGPC